MENQSWIRVRSLVASTKIAGDNLLSATQMAARGKTKTIIVGFLSDLQKSGMYEIINHKYLIRGHTYLKNEWDFRQIEKRKKSAADLVLKIGLW